MSSMNSKYLTARYKALENFAMFYKREGKAFLDDLHEYFKVELEDADKRRREGTGVGVCRLLQSRPDGVTGDS